MPDVVAQVNGKTITKEDLIQNARQMQAQMAATSRGRQVPSLDAGFYKQVLDGMVAQTLILQDAQRQGVQVSDAELKPQIEALRRRFPDETAFKKALELDSDFGSALSRLIDVYLVTGQYSAAEALLQKRREALGEATVQTAQLYAKTGRLAEARALMVLSPTAAGGGIGVGPALVAVALGQHDAALDSIERAVRARRLCVRRA